MRPGPLGNEADAARGIHYADGGVGWGTLAYPDPERVARMNDEWKD